MNAYGLDRLRRHGIFPCMDRFVGDAAFRLSHLISLRTLDRLLSVG